MKTFAIKSKCPVLDRLETHFIDGRDADQAILNFRQDYPFRSIVSLEDITDADPKTV